MIDQNTIIIMLNEVVPMMQKSKNPETTLLEYAKSKNLPPSILERMTHAFNQLKTICFMDSADCDEKRGGQFAIIDAPTLLQKYTEFGGDNIGDTFSDDINEASKFWGIDPGDSISIKIASSELKEDTLDSLIKDNKSEYGDYEVLYEKEFAKVASDNKSLDNLAETNLVDEFFDNKRSLESFNEYKEYLFQKRSSIIDNVKKSLLSDEALVSKFASFEEDAILLDNDTKNVIDSFINELTHNNSYLKDNIKLANIDNVKKHLIKEIHPISKAIIDYKDTLKCIKVAEEVENDMDLPPIPVEIPTESYTLSFDDINDLDVKPKDRMSVSSLSFDDANNNDNSNKSKQEKDEAEKNIDTKEKKSNKTSGNPKQTSKNNKNTVTQEELENAIRDQKRSEEFLKDLGNSFYKSIGESSQNAINDFANINKWLIERNFNAKKTESQKGKEVLKKIYNKLSDALFQKIMLTDPILSKLDKTDVGNVVDAYKTYKIQYPEIAFQPALMKSLLRGAAQVSGGEDISALKELINARKNLAQARAAEKDLGMSLDGGEY